MGRLPALVLVAALGCDDDGSTPPARPMSRGFDAVVATAPPKVEPPTEFCDLFDGGKEPRSFAFPELAEPAPPTTPGWLWVNVWATWCVPCVAEMPMLERWKTKLQQDGLSVQFTYLSVDDDPQAVEAFRKNRQLGQGPRTKSFEVLPAWLTSIGLDATAAIPLNLFVDPAGKLRCVRMGALEEHHYDAVTGLFKPSEGVTQER
jgi:thiol-disulfide isomerase/thioredoxin